MLCSEVGAASVPPSGISSAAHPPPASLCPPEAHLRNGEDAQGAFLEVQEAVMPEIQEQIQDYRSAPTTLVADRK